MKTIQIAELGDGTYSVKEVQAEAEGAIEQGEGGQMAETSMQSESMSEVVAEDLQEALNTAQQMLSGEGGDEQMEQDGFLSVLKSADKAGV